MVSIGMPVYNDREFLAKSIESLLNQTYKDFELLISDDCSTDGSMMICEFFARQDSRIKYIRQSITLGISRNMEFLLANATGQYFMWAADDDLWHPNFISNLLEALSKSTSGIVAFCPYSFIDENGCRIDYMKTRIINYSSKMPIKRLFKLILKWDDGFGYGLFIREKIKNVRFPIWWGINKTSAINNIYPSLFYYLSIGNYVAVPGETLWFNRIKPTNYINHHFIYSNSYLKSFLIFALRKFNVYIKCNESIIRANIYNTYLVILLFPFFIIKFLIDLINELESGVKSLIKRRNNLFTTVK